MTTTTTTTTAAAAPAAAPTPASFASSTLSPIEALVLSRAFTSEKEAAVIERAIPSPMVEVPFDFTVRLSGSVKRGKAGDRKPTSRALRKATLALLVRRMGLQRDAALDLLAQVLVEAHQLGEDAERALLEEHPEVSGAFERVDAFIGVLPRIETAGRISLDLEVERIT